jgi:hypothetical protein
MTHSRVKRRVTRAVRPTKRTDFTEADGEPEGKIVFQLEKESEHETFKGLCREIYNTFFSYCINSNSHLNYCIIRQSSFQLFPLPFLSKEAL